MNILAIDTATEILSAALKTDKGQWYIEIAAGLRHSELLMEVCDKLINMAEISKKDLDLIACMQGPGSFTGLRIGFAAAKGMSSALNIPFISIPTLDCMAHPYRFWQGPVLPVIDAKKQCFFTALYHEDNRIHDYADLPTEEILSFLKDLKNPDLLNQQLRHRAAEYVGSAKEIDLGFDTMNAPKGRGIKPSPTNPDQPILVCGPDAELFCKRMKESTNLDTLTIIQATQNNAGYAKCLLEKAENQYIINYRKGGLLGDSPLSGPMYLRKSDAELSVKK
jgi:tRNA threonylcarbamoyl adenosine modification protein YeaZ